MNEEALISAALRNREARMAQIARLTPRKGEAAMKAQALREATGRAQAAREEVRQMDELRHIPNFFPTPPWVLDEMLRMIRITIMPGTRALDPSAGKGNLLVALRGRGCAARGIELAQPLAEIVRKKGFECECADFLSRVPTDDSERAELVFMNPPFERATDRKHIAHAVQWLDKRSPRGCQLIAVCSRTTAECLREWVESQRGEIKTLSPSAFANSERSTGVSTAIVSISF